MRIWFVTDLHLEQASWSSRMPPADLVVIAGDLCEPLTDGLRFVERHISPAGVPVIVVPGNHDFYNVDMLRELDRARAFADRIGVHLLSDDEIVLDGVRFLGTTLWTDYRLAGCRWRGHVMAEADQHRTDHKRILYDGGRFTPLIAAELHERSENFLKGRLSEPHDGPTVVISHHAPHANCVHPRHRDRSDVPCYASDLSAIMARPDAPEFWLHGHTHYKCDFVVGRTRILSNPRGRGNERQFDPSFVFDVLDVSTGKTRELALTA